MKIKFKKNKMALKILSIFLLAFFIITVFHVPYLNITLAPYLGFISLYFLCFIFFGLERRRNIIISLILFIVAGIMTLMKLNDLAEQMGDTIFLLLVTSGALSFFEERKKS